MTNNRSIYHPIRLASVAILSSFLLSACVQTLDFYDDEYYPAEQTVFVKHPRPVYHRVDVYETRPAVIVNRPAPYYYGHHYYHQAPAHISAQVVVRPKAHHHHEHNTTVVKPYSQSEDVNTTVVKDYRHSSQSEYRVSPQNNYETHNVLPPSRTSVKQHKKIVIQGSSDAPPSTLAE